jgi:predicted transcriptional regulator
LLRHDYIWAQYTSHEKVIEDNKENYYVCLRDVQSTLQSDAPVYEKWVTFFLKTVSIQAEFLSGKIIKESPVSIMNNNEKNIYQIIETAGECKISYILDNTDMKRAGLKSLLKRLADKGLIKTQGQGKGTTYLVN